MRRLTIAVLSIVGLAATTRVVWNTRLGSGPPQVARQLAANQGADLQARIQAIVEMQRDARATMAALRAIALEGGEIAQHARNAITSIEAAGK